MILHFGQNFKAPEKSSGLTKKRRIDDTKMEEDDDEEDEQHMDDSLPQRRTRSGNRGRSTSRGVDNRLSFQPGQPAQDIPRNPRDQR